MRMLRTELSRLLARRAVLLLLAAAVVLPALIGAVVAWDHRPISEADLARAEAQVATDRDQPWVQEELRDCLAHPERFSPEERAGDVEAFCREMVEPSVEWYLWRSELDIADQARWGSGIALATVVMALLMLAGTTFIGHDWATGSVTNQLLFEPRRSRVWTAKAIAVALVAAGASAVVHVGYWWALWAIARGYGHQQQSGALEAAMYQSGRAVALTTAAAVGAYAVTMLFRSTVGTLGIMAVVAIAGSITLGVLGVSPQWQPALALDAVLHNGTTYSAAVPCGDLPQDAGEFGPGHTCYVDKELPLWHGAAYLGTLLVLAVGLVVRSTGGPVLLYTGAAACGAGIAVMNVVMPGLVKRHFPERAGLMTGVYVTGLVLGASAAAASPAGADEVRAAVGDLRTHGVASDGRLRIAGSLPAGSKPRAGRDPEKLSRWVSSNVPPAASARSRMV
jgi:hypothetical protein